MLLAGGPKSPARAVSPRGLQIGSITPKAPQGLHSPTGGLYSPPPPPVIDIIARRIDAVADAPHGHAAAPGGP